MPALERRSGWGRVAGEIIATYLDRATVVLPISGDFNRLTAEAISRWRTNLCGKPQKVASSSNGVLHTRHAQLDARAHEAP